MKMTMKNIHVLSKNKETRLFTSNSELTLAGYPVTTFKTGKHIYITNSEEIKEGDWCILLENHYVNGGIGKYNTEKAIGYGLHNTKFFKKIILTTDKDLINDDVQAISDEFLEWFVKNQSCEEVEVIPYLKDIINPLTNEKFPAVQHRHFDETKMIFRYHYKIIIPKEEPKQEILEESLLLNQEFINGKSISELNDSMKEFDNYQIDEYNHSSSIDWLLRYIEYLNNKGYTFIPSSNKEIVEHIKQMEKDNMIAFLKFVFQQDGFDYEQAYNNFLKQQIL